MDQELKKALRFPAYWETDKAVSYRHADERIQAEEAWNAALEEAAKLAWSWGEDTLIDRIRALKSKP